jgi:hypothetical protein
VNRAVLVVALSLFLGLSCSSQGEPPSIYHEAPAVEDYLESVLPGFAGLLELEEVDAARYSSLVRKFRREGLESLTDEERADFLRVAQAAFLSQAETLRYLVTSRNASPRVAEDRDGYATVEELYVEGTLSGEEDASDEHLVLLLGGAHVKSQSILWFAPMPMWDPEASGELWELVSFAADGEEAGLGSGVGTDWTYRDGEWTCVTVDLSTAYYYYTLEEGRAQLYSSFADGTMLGRDTLNGQAVYQFEGDQDFEVEHVRYWLDAETLWLRQYEFEDPSGALITVKLEAVNEDIRIEPPDVDVECVEEELGE